MPALLEMEHIGGDLHVHTDWSDGQGSIADMARVARKLKYNFIGITDHSAGFGIAHGLDMVRPAAIA